MQRSFTWGPLNIWGGISWSRRTFGMNSNLEDGRHVIFWDFDNTPQLDVYRALTVVQANYRLPEIQVYRSSPGDNYHAICWTSVGWPMLLAVLADTKGLDQAFFKIGVVRGYFTLRIKAKPVGPIAYLGTLPSAWRNYQPVEPESLPYGQAYWTKRA